MGLRVSLVGASSSNPHHNVGITCFLKAVDICQKKNHISFSTQEGQVSTILHSKAYLLHGKAKEIEEVEVVSISTDGQIPLDISLDAMQVEQDDW